MSRAIAVLLSRSRPPESFCRCRSVGRGMPLVSRRPPSSCLSRWLRSWPHAARATGSAGQAAPRIRIRLRIAMVSFADVLARAYGELGGVAQAAVCPTGAYASGLECSPCSACRASLVEEAPCGPTADTLCGVRTHCLKLVHDIACVCVCASVV